MTPYYSEDGITIYHGDCRELLPSITDTSIDLIVTDPPYGHNNNNNDLIHNREKALGRPAIEHGKPRPIRNDGPEANDLARWLFDESRRLLKPGSCICCCCGGGGPDPQFARWSLWLDDAVGFKQAIVWDKGGLGMGWHYRRNYEMILVGQKPGAACKWYGGHSQANVVNIPGIKPSSLDHPTPKPVSLMGLFIRLHSETDDLVLDPFVGGGATLRAAKDLGRRAVGCEIDEGFCEMTAKRLAQGALSLANAS